MGTKKKKTKKKSNLESKENNTSIDSYSESIYNNNL